MQHRVHSVVSRVRALAIAALSALWACSAPPVVADGGDAVAPTDTMAPTDAVTPTDTMAPTDAVTPADAATPSDVTSPVDATVRPDASCDPVAAERPMPMGQCDGRGMLACAMWAQQNAGGNPMANAICLSGTQSGCARADQCMNMADPSTCRCGGSAACAAGQVCVSVGPLALCRPVACP